MYDWLAEAMRNTVRTDDAFAAQRLIFSKRDVVDRLISIELRDRWGYHLSPLYLAEIAVFIEENADLEGLGRRSRERGAMAEIVDRVALQMLTGDMAQFCSGYDTPAEDELIETVVRTTLNLKESS